MDLWQLLCRRLSAGELIAAPGRAGGGAEREGGDLRRLEVAIARPAPTLARSGWPARAGALEGGREGGGNSGQARAPPGGADRVQGWDSKDTQLDQDTDTPGPTVSDLG